jgi:putative colanic acid biosynthesis glycosyltransferase
MLRVLQINSVCGVGSTGRIAVRIRDGLVRAGGRGWIAYGRGAASQPETIRIGTAFDVLAHGSLTRAFDTHGTGSRRATASLLSHLDSLRPDVIHLHNIHGYYINFELLFEYLKQQDTPVVWTLHDCWSFTGHCSHYAFVGCAKWQTACSDCPQTSEYPSSWHTDASAEMFRRKQAAFTGVRKMTLVTPSAWLSNELTHSFLRHYPRQVIPNGIDLNVFKPAAPSDVRARFGIPKHADVVLGVAPDFAQPRKGLSYLIEMASRLPNAVVVLVGAGRSVAKRLPTNVIALPRTNSVDDLVSLYSLASVFVDPTLEDTFPTVILEAQACGTPVVTFATGGCPEQIGPDTGVVVPTGDSNALFAATRSVLRAGKEAYSLASRAHALRFSDDIMAGAYLETYLNSARIRGGA